MGVMLHTPNFEIGDTLWPNLPTETMISVEVRELSLRRQHFDLSLNQESMSIRLNLLNEMRDRSKIREASCKLWVYNAKVQLRIFQKGDLVWKTNGKFSSN